MDQAVAAAKTAWVTGGSAGIGRATVDLLRARGAKLGVLDLEQPSDDTPWVRCDLSDAGSVRTAGQELAAQTGLPDILVCCAGIPSFQRIEVQSDDEWQRVLGVNLTGALHCIRLCLPAMLSQRWGRIVTVASGGAVRVREGRAAYATSKAGLIALTKVAAVEGAAAGVTANVVAPGVTDTEFATAVYGDRKKVANAARASSVSNPMGVIMEPIDIAEAIAFFCRPESRYITGQVLHVSGGSVM